MPAATPSIDSSCVTVAVPMKPIVKRFHAVFRCYHQFVLRASPAA